MRKLKLLMAACTLLLGAGQTWAQIDVTSKYLTNASFESGDMTGWTSYGYNSENNEGVVDASSFGGSKLVENFPLSNSDGEYICDFYGNRWTGWWSFYTISQTVLLPAGEYQLTAILGSSNGYTVSLFAFPQDSGEQNAVATYSNISSETLSSDDQNNVGYLKTVSFTSDGSTPMVLGAGLINHPTIWGTFFKADNFKLYRLTNVTSTYITNAGFDACTAETSDVAAKTKKDYSSNGWTNANTGDYTTIAVTAYGGGKKVGGSTTPSTKKDGSTVSGNTLGIIAGWGDEVKIQSGNITLLAGYYTLTVDHYLTSSSTNYDSSSSRFGFVTSSNSYLASTTFTASTWTTETVTFTLTETTTGKIQLGLKGNNKTGSDTPAVFYDDVTLTYIPFADATDYSNLNSAISTVEGKAWGFDEGEYAPYNYVEVLQALAEAKAIDQEANNSQATVLNLTSIMNNAVWTANASEVNAIWDGAFEHDYSGLAGNVQPIGWYRVKGTSDDGYNVRYASTGDFAGVAYTSSDHGLFTKLNAYYGWGNGYTMPLNGDTYYTISFVTGGAGDCSDLTCNIDIINPSEETTRIKTYAVQNTTANSDATSSSWSTIQQIFKTDDAGNYVLGLVPRNSGKKSQNQFLYGDFVLKTTTIAEATDYYNAVKDEVDDDYNAEAHGGSEKTAFKEALDASAPSSIAEIMEAAANLYTLRDAFVAATPKYNAFEAERQSAIDLGVTPSSANAVTMTSASQLQEKLQELYVLEDAAVTSGYVVDATTKFGSWTTQNLDTKNDQHWSGTTVTYYDRWQNSGYTSSITSTVTLPAGKYVFKLAARAQTGSINGAFNMSVKVGENAAVYKDFVAKDNSGKGITTSGAVSYSDGEFCNDGNGRGWEWRFIAFELNDEASVTLKGYAQILANNWVGFSDATLLTTTDNIEICRQLYESSKDAAEAARDNEDYTIVIGTERATLNAAIGEEVPEPVTYSWYQTQKAALDEATAALINAKPAYVALSEVNNTVAAELGVSTVPAATSSSTAADITAALNTQNVDEYTAATTNYTYNATSLLGAWSNAPGNNHGQSWNGTTGDGSDEYYDLYNAAARSMTQTVTLPKAKYVLIAKGRASTDGRLTLSDGTNTITFPHKGNDGKGIETDGTPNFGSGTYSNDGNGNGWEYRFLTFESDGSTSTTLTFNWTTASNNWAGLDDITLLAIPEIVTIAENDTEAPDYSIADVKLTRTLSASYWNTFSVPFDMDIPDGWTVKEFDSATDNVITFKDATTIEAGKPYLVKPTANVENPTYNGVIVQNIEGSTVGEGDYKFAAQIYNKTLATDGTIAYLATDGKVKKLTSGGLKGLRAYFIIPAGAEARIAFLDDETTGITEMKQQSNSEEMVIYDLNGRRVQNMQKGIYIVNGKKIVK